MRPGGLAWTILQPSCFMEIWFGPAIGWDVAGGKARVFGPGTAPVSFICALDVAEFAVLAATRLMSLGAAVAKGDVIDMTPYSGSFR